MECNKISTGVDEQDVYFVVQYKEKDELNYFFKIKVFSHIIKFYSLIYLIVSCIQIKVQFKQEVRFFFLLSPYSGAE